MVLILTFYFIAFFSKVYDAIPLQNQIQNLYSGMEKLVAGLLPSTFISPQAIKETILDIEATLLETMPTIKVLHTDPSFYYRHNDFLYIRNNTDLYITLKFPMTQEDIITLEVYQIVIFPVHFHNSSEFSTILTSNTQTFFISQQSDYYAESTLPFSPRDTVSVDILMRMTTPSCLLAIFQDHADNIKSFCEFQVMPSLNILPDLYILDYPQILIRNSPQAQLQCPNRKKLLLNSSYFFYTVPGACAIQTTRSYLPPRINQCDSDNSSESENPPQFPLNLALLQHFFSNDTLAGISGDLLFNQSISIELPPMKFFNHSFDDKLAQAHAIAYQLDKVINATKADEQIFRSMVDPLLTGDITIPMDFFFTPPGYLTLANTVGTVTNLVLVAYLVYKVRIQQAALAMIPQHFPQARAFTLPNFVVTLPSSSTRSPLVKLPTSVDPFNGIAYLVLIILLLYILKKICRYRQNRFQSSPDFDICLEVKKNGTCCFLTLQTVPGCPSDYLTTGSNLCTNVYVSGWFYPQINITWADFAMINKQTNRSVYLSATYKISWLQRFKLRSVFTNQYVLLLFFSHAGKGMYVAL